MTDKKKVDPKAEACLSDESHNSPHLDKPKASFPIIGIGASAGGLEALELFLRNIPVDSGMAFIIVQHLDPTRKDLMVELLQRITPIQVMQVIERTHVQPNCIYIIPPNKDMSIFHGILHLFEPAEPRGLRLPIDFFFRSLAEDLKERSIGVILSGMGTDGTIGLGFIKDRGGVVFVQEPTSAKYDSMPKSAIKAGLADIVIPVEEMPAKIISYLQYKPSFASSETALTEKNQSSLEKIMYLLRSKTGQDFSLYKNTTVCRRLERRMGIHQIENLTTYVRLLQENPQELDLLYKELLIGVTNFFRDPEVWELLKTEAIPQLLTERKNQALRAWVPGCATGEEAYTLAIVFKEMMDQLEPTQNITLQIFATDISLEAVKKAREAVYPVNISADLSPERLQRFFIQVEDGFQVAKPLREMVVFAQQNVIMDPPFTKLDILSCRNLLIYLTSELQKKIIPLFHYSIKPGGYLLLGKAESIGNNTSLFKPLHGKSRLYRRLESTIQADMVEFPLPHAFTPSSSPSETVVNMQSLVDQLLLKRFTPPSVMVNNKGDILYINGRTGVYLEPAAGKANWNVFAMIREGLGYPLNKAFQKAIQKNEVVVVKNAVVKTNGETHTVDITIQPLEEPDVLRGMVLIIFSEVARPRKTKVKDKTSDHEVSSILVSELEEELRQAHHELENIREDMQSSQEKLSATNEELQSTNEELQSTNEELTTSKEEMQSLNEELQTINHELQAKVDELFYVNNDLKNLLESTDIATLFLDNRLRVRRFTAKTAEIIKLIPADIGRLITDIVSSLDYPEFIEDTREVLRTLSFKEKSVSATGGRWFTVKIMPYRTFDDKVDGLVITFMDITISKTLEAALRQSQTDLEKRMVKKDSDLNKAKKRLQSKINKEIGEDHHE
ncbi:MAG: chemotaxis protein CheB [Bacillota bacterium]|nr:chemotaxis protein CheB [Bacillota bacterium]